MAALAGAQFNSKHSRGPGGLFAAQSAAAGHPTGAWAAGPMSYDPKTRKGAGHGIPGGDPRVRALQQALNGLGFGGRGLAVDGDLGPKTTASVKAAQRQLGLKPDGVVTAQLMVAILSMKPPARKTAAAKMAAGKSKPHGTAKRPAKAAPAKATPAKPTARMVYATGTRTRAKAI